MIDSSSVTDGTPALFVADGNHVLPTELARGPWSAQSLHGGPVAALIARSIERHTGENDLQLVRVTVELLRPVPVAPLEVTCTLSKAGRKVQLIDTVVEADGVGVAWARALRIRRAPDDQRAMPSVPEDDAPPPPEDGVAIASALAGYRAFHNAGMELRFVEGHMNEPGPATVWFRLRCPVVLGEPPSPWQRVAAAADFGNGVGSELDFASSLFINPDLTVSIHRPPEGEWVCLAARTRFGTPGIGAAESELWDVHGRIGRAVQSLLVEPTR